MVNRILRHAVIPAMVIASMVLAAGMAVQATDAEAVTAHTFEILLDTGDRSLGAYTLELEYSSTPTTAPIKAGSPWADFWIMVFQSRRASTGVAGCGSSCRSACQNCPAL